MNDLGKELKKISLELNIVQEVYCTDEEEKEFRKMEDNKTDLPSDVYTSLDGSHFRYVRTGLSKDEIVELLLYRQTKYLKSIKNSMLFFVVLTVISVFFTLLLLSRH